MKRWCCFAIAGVAMTWLSSAYAGPQWDISDNCWMKLSFLGQANARYEKDAADEEDIYIRRARIILAGQVQDGIQFFAETDNDNGGRNGGGAVGTDIQDMFVDFRLMKSDCGEAWLAGGLILLPFSFENKSSAASILGIDYNSEAIKLVNTFVWRDYGAELHGNCGKRVSARVGVFDGADPYSTTAIEKNPGASLRYTGHMAVNLLGEAETGSFYTQERLKDGHYLSLGAGFDAQGDATRTIVDPTDPEAVSVVQDSDAWVIDMQSGFDCGCAKFTLNAGYYDWDNGSFKGNTAAVEGGAKMNKVEATGKVTLTDPDTGSDTTDYTLGLNYFFKGHNARAGVEYRWGDSDDMVLGGVQVLL